MRIAAERDVSIHGGTFNDVRGDYITNIMNSVLDILRQAASHSAPYDSGARHPAPNCLDGTRQDVLAQIQRWINNPQETRIFWLNGTAGIGKTTIAQTVAEICAKQHILGASFFFCAGAADRAPLTLFPSIAYQLIHTFSSLKSLVEAAIHLDPHIPFKQPRHQFEKLIIDPLSQLQELPPSPLVIVIDSLHESENDRWVEEILSLLEASLQDPRLPLRFFITSQPESYIQTRFSSPTMRPLVSTLSLHDYDAKPDIRIFLRHRFSEIYVKHQHALQDVQAPWPSDHEIDKLVEKSAGLFLYASTVGNLTDDRRTPSQPKEQLDLVLSTKQAPGKTTYANLDCLYTRFLSGISPKVYDDSVRPVIGTILLLSDSLPLKDMEDLLQLKDGDARRALNGLQGFLDVPYADGDGRGEMKTANPVRLLHSEFREYLVDKERSNSLAIDAVRCHGDIAQFCLQLMIRLTKKNVHKLSEHRDHALNNRRADLHQGGDNSDSNALHYARDYWAPHLSQTSYRTSLVNDLRIFAANCLKPWILDLSRHGELHVAVSALRYVQQWLKKSPSPPVDLLDAFSVAERLIDTHFKDIHQGSLGVYRQSLVTNNRLFSSKSRQSLEAQLDHEDPGTRVQDPDSSRFSERPLALQRLKERRKGR